MKTSINKMRLMPCDLTDFDFAVVSAYYHQRTLNPLRIPIDWRYNTRTKLVLDYSVQIADQALAKIILEVRDADY